MVDRWVDTWWGSTPEYLGTARHKLPTRGTRSQARRCLLDIFLSHVPL